MLNAKAAAVITFFRQPNFLISSFLGFSGEIFSLSMIFYRL
jgi:hypothetical protein